VENLRAQYTRIHYYYIFSRVQNALNYKNALKHFTKCHRSVSCKYTFWNNSASISDGWLAVCDFQFLCKTQH